MEKRNAYFELPTIYTTLVDPDTAQTQLEDIDGNCSHLEVRTPTHAMQLN